MALLLYFRIDFYLFVDNLKPVLHGVPNSNSIPSSTNKELYSAVTQCNVVNSNRAVGSVIKLASSLTLSSSLKLAAERPFLIQAKNNLADPVNVVTHDSSAVSKQNSEVNYTLTKPSSTIKSTLNASSVKSVIEFSSSSSNVVQPFIPPPVHSSSLPINIEGANAQNMYNKGNTLVVESVKKNLDTEDFDKTTNKIANISSKRKRGKIHFDINK